MHLFARAMTEVRIKLFNHGDMRRDFTYIDDVTEAVRLIDHVPSGGATASRSGGEHRAVADLQRGQQPFGGFEDVIALLRKSSYVRAVKELRRCSPATCP